MQAIIGNYAVPVLEEKQVWGTSDDTRTAYLDSQVALLKEPQGYSFANQALLSAYPHVSEMAVPQHLCRMRQGSLAVPYWKLPESAGCAGCGKDDIGSAEE